MLDNIKQFESLEQPNKIRQYQTILKNIRQNQTILDDQAILDKNIQYLTISQYKTIRL